MIRSCQVLVSVVAGINLFGTVPADAADEPPPRVPEGFVVERVADASLVQHPMMGCFDDRGRLFVCESAGTNRPAAELLEDPLDKILLLEDVDGDGVFDRSTVFADKMVFPQGCLWYGGALYTCSSPYLWKLEDLDDDGVCDQRTVLVKSFGFSGNAADIHGPFLAPDGRLYWCDGRHGHEIRDLGEGEFGGEDTALEIPPDPEPGLPNPDGALFSRGRAARIFSCRPDGSDVQILCGGGMDNPVEVDFWETGECIGSVNLFYGRPRGDCLVHWTRDGVYPRFDQQDVIAEFAWTGGLLSPVHNYGHVAVSGVTRYRSGERFLEPRTASGGHELGGDAAGAPLHRGADASRSSADAHRFPGDAERATFFVTQFNTHKVVKTVLERDGATFRHVSTDDFLVSEDADFHPTDVIEDADGSLLVIDTGGWFRIGCPTSQIAKPEIAGAIYRVRPENPAPTGAARPAGAAPEQMIQPLGAVAGEHGSVLAALHDASETVRIAAINALPHGDLEAVMRADVRDRLGRMISTDTPAVSRAAAECLTAAGLANGSAEGAIVEDVMSGLRREDLDRVLEHALIAALVRLDHPHTEAYLGDPHPRVRRAALIAIDQMEHGNLTRKQVLPLLDSNDPELQQAVLEVISRRQGWASATVELLDGWLHDELTAEQTAILRSFLPAQAADESVQKLVATHTARPEVDPATAQLLLETMEASAGLFERLPQVWAHSVETVLSGEHLPMKLAALRVIAAFDADRFDETLAGIADDPAQPAELRVEALGALAARLRELSADRFALLVERLREADDPLDRLAAARVLTAAPLSVGQLSACAESIGAAGPLAAATLLKAFTSSPHEQAMPVLLAALAEDEAAVASLPHQELARIIRDAPDDVQRLAAPLLDRLEVDVAEQQQRLAELMRLTEGGDAARGYYVFFGEAAACSRCHRIGDRGTAIGPDLSRISSIRQPRDLLESIVFPSASFARGYEAYDALLEDGRVISGVISRETADAVVLRTTDLREIRISRGEIDVLQRSSVSIMPQGLDSKLSESDLRDLLAYLRGLR